MFLGIQFVVLLLTLHQVSSDADIPRKLTFEKNLDVIPIFTPANLTIRCEYSEGLDSEFMKENLSRPVSLSIQQAQTAYNFKTLVSIDIVSNKVIQSKDVAAAQLPDQTQAQLGAGSENGFLEATWINPSSVQQGRWQCTGNFINQDTGDVAYRIKSSALYVNSTVDLDSVSEAYEELLGKQ